MEIQKQMQVQLSVKPKLTYWSVSSQRFSGMEIHSGVTIDMRKVTSLFLKCQFHSINLTPSGNLAWHRLPPSKGRIYPLKFSQGRSHRALALVNSLLFIWLFRHKYIAPSKASQCSLSSGFPDLHHKMGTHVPVLIFLSQEVGTRRTPFTCLSHFLSL